MNPVSGVLARRQWCDIFIWICSVGAKKSQTILIFRKLRIFLVSNFLCIASATLLRSFRQNLWWSCRICIADQNQWSALNFYHHWSEPENSLKFHLFVKFLCTVLTSTKLAPKLSDRPQQHCDIACSRPVVIFTLSQYWQNHLMRRGGDTWWLHETVLADSGNTELRRGWISPLGKSWQVELVEHTFNVQKFWIFCSFFYVMKIILSASIRRESMICG